MITCVFAGHRQIFKANISEKVKETLEKLIENESRIVFLNGNIGRFDDVCAGAVRTLKKKYPEKEIRNCLVIAYYSNRLNTEKSYLQSLYDEILFPDHDYGGAYQTYRYAQKKSIPIINIAEGATICLK